MAQASSPNLIWFRTPPWTDISAHLRVSLYFWPGHFGARRNLTVISVYVSSDLSVSRRFQRTLLRDRASLGLGGEPSEARTALGLRWHRFGFVGLPSRKDPCGSTYGGRSTLAVQLRHVRHSVYGGIASGPSVYLRVRPAFVSAETPVLAANSPSVFIARSEGWRGHVRLPRSSRERIASIRESYHSLE